MPPLSPETDRRVAALFLGEAKAAATRLLVEQCGRDLLVWAGFAERLDAHAQWFPGS